MERLGDDARRLLARAGVAGTDRLAAVLDVWRECVGDAIARAAWPQRFARDGTLHVATTSSAWAFELARLGPDIEQRLLERLADDAPAALRFAPGPVPAEAAQPSSDDASRTLEISPASARAGAEIAAGIEDDELRKLVARAASASLERAGDDRGFC
jgi:hypothetical protein